ncbi:MAG TPA: class I SAM-dependent methyltransferase [Vicinamibacteria bacterium]|nr:class I SAM-dependent methyltransferase [Vicinamibacteria bacterium]
MISADLIRRLACPVCLEPAGCSGCWRPAQDHNDCLSHYAGRAGCACGGPDKVALLAQGDSLVCPCCRVAYPLRSDGGYVDLVPRTSLGEVTQYADHEFHERLEVKDAPPLLSARVKADMMRRMLGLGSGEEVLDLGCGAGKFALYAGANGRASGVDVAPFFLPRAVALVDLVLGDLRRLPFRKGVFPRAYSLDVLEHLDEEGVREILLEARRTLAADGRLFVYTHAMESSRLAGFQRLVNRLAKRLGRVGLVDHEREALRKSDHRNAIRSHEHFEALAAGAGLELVERRYYNVVLKAVIEDLLLRMVEQWRRRRSAGGSALPDQAGDRQAIGAPPPGRLALRAAQALSWLLKLDVVLFGGIRTGPFFGLLRPRLRPR